MLENGADPNLRDNSGETPLDLTSPSIVRPPTLLLPPRGPQFAAPGPQTALAEPGSLQELLRQHGAIEDLPRMDRIELRRSNYSSVVFAGYTNDFNRFTLLELLAVHYGFVSDARQLLNRIRPENAAPVFDGTSRTIHGSLEFPNLDRIEIRRPESGTRRTRIPVFLTPILEIGSCSCNVKLEWGDQVEIPEADHPLNAHWQGFSQSVLTNFLNCLKRQVQLTVKGQTTNLLLEVPIPFSNNPVSLIGEFRYTPPQFCLLPALQNSGLLRASSDLSRVKVTRQGRTDVFDCSASPPPALWLRDGDVIDVPDKQ